MDTIRIGNYEIKEVDDNMFKIGAIGGNQYNYIGVSLKELANALIERYGWIDATIAPPCTGWYSVKGVDFHGQNMPIAKYNQYSDGGGWQVHYGGVVQDVAPTHYALITQPKP